MCQSCVTHVVMCHSCVTHVSCTHASCHGPPTRPPPHPPRAPTPTHPHTRPPPRPPACPSTPPTCHVFPMPVRLPTHHTCVPALPVQGCGAVCAAAAAGRFAAAGGRRGGRGHGAVCLPPTLARVSEGGGPLCGPAVGVTLLSVWRWTPLRACCRCDTAVGVEDLAFLSPVFPQSSPHGGTWSVHQCVVPVKRIIALLGYCNVYCLPALLFCLFCQELGLFRWEASLLPCICLACA